MTNPLISTKFLAALASSVIMGILVAVGVDLTTALVIVAPLASYVPFQAVADLRKPQLTPEQVAALTELLAAQAPAAPAIAAPTAPTPSASPQGAK